MATLTNRGRAILGDLTTTFTPPAPCTTAIGLCETCNVAWWGQTCGMERPEDNASCWPTTTDGAPEAASAFYGWGFYSPGLECPVGYTSACTAVEGGMSEWRVQFQMEAQETFVGCCPTGFNCHNQNGQTCIMKATSTELRTVSCDAGSSTNFGFTTLPNVDVKSMWLYAPMIQLAWKASDRPGSTTLSTDGAVAGIAVGAALLFLLALAAAILVWRRKRVAARGGQHGALSASDAGASTQLPAYSDGGYDSANAAKYYYTGGLVEAPATSGVYEVPGQGHGRVEVSGENLGPVEMPGYGRAPGAVEMPSERYH
ncbi:hypothetical protein N0V88_007565 [Collariella sp. IMI 366227]|nr:hypothetical protein N0V88_007565 [Collariella sp. IMI 366227]